MSQIKSIEAIEIENVRGIGASRTFKVEFLANKPTMLVAPNGSGKSSVAAAFSLLKSKKIELHKEAYHQGDESLKLRLSVTYVLSDKTSHRLEADDCKNEIAGVFDVNVINSRLIPKAKKSKIGGATVASASLEVEPIVLVRSIPERVKLAYDSKVAKALFGSNGKVLPNISAILRNNKALASLSDVDLAKHIAAKSVATVAAFQNKLNGSAGTTQDILRCADVTMLQSLPYLCEVVEVLKQNGISFDHEASYFLAALSIADVYEADKAAFQKAIKYAEYSALREMYEREFSFLRSTWKNISPKEEDGQLVINFPKASQISNGERDVITFLALLLSAKARFSKKPVILIIDEIFDYLDDANIVACQYHITRMIEEMKVKGVMLFPIIMSHLDPSYFRNYYFKKLKVVYLSGGAPSTSRLEKVIFKRDEPSIEDDLAKYFLHYHPAAKDLSAEFAALKLPFEFSSTTSFLKKIDAECQKYLQGQPYDPIAVCCVVRRAVEKAVYDLLNPGNQAGFLAENRTVNKLDFAVEKGVTVPDAYYLLGIVYNVGLHVKENWDNLTPIRSQLDHLTIKQMIKTVVK